MSIKVLVISNYNSVVVTRPEAEIFLGLKKLGLDIHIMTYADSEYAKRFKEAGIRVIDFHPEKKFNAAETGRIRQELISGGYQIVHLFNSKAIINGIRAAKGLPVKVVLYRGYTGNIDWWDPTAYLKFLHPRVDKIMCNSKGVEEHIQKQLFFSKNKTITINKGHRLEWYEGVKPLDLKNINIPRDAFVVTCVANTRRMKGMKYLLKSTYYLPAEYPVHLLLVGNGLDSKSNKKLADKSPFYDHIHFLGFRDDALRIVASSNVFILASVKGESITKSVIEAMALGIAPIITNIPGNRELVVHDKNGLVVPSRNPKALADAIIKLYHDKDKCKQFGQLARKHIAEDLNCELTIEQTKDLYESLLEK